MGNCVRTTPWLGSVGEQVLSDTAGGRVNWQSPSVDLETLANNLTRLHVYPQVQVCQGARGHGVLRETVAEASFSVVDIRGGGS